MSPQKRKPKKTKGKKKRKSPSRPLPASEPLLPESLVDIRVEGATVPQWRAGFGRRLCHFGDRRRGFNILMGELMRKYRGKADGKLISDVANRELDKVVK